MPRLRGSRVDCKRLGEIRRTIVRLPRGVALPAVRAHAIWGFGCWGSRHPNPLRIMPGFGIAPLDGSSVSASWIPFAEHPGRDRAGSDPLEPLRTIGDVRAGQP
jgi:hypothetical protein